MSFVRVVRSPPRPCPDGGAQRGGAGGDVAHAMAAANGAPIATARNNANPRANNTQAEHASRSSTTSPATPSIYPPIHPPIHRATAPMAESPALRQQSSSWSRFAHPLLLGHPQKHWNMKLVVACSGSSAGRHSIKIENAY